MTFYITKRMYLLFVDSTQALPLMLVVRHHAVGQSRGQLPRRCVFLESDNSHTVLRPSRVQVTNNHSKVGNGQIYNAGCHQEVEYTEPSLYL